MDTEYTESIEEVVVDYNSMKEEEIENEVMYLFLFGDKDKYMLGELFSALSSVTTDTSLILLTLSKMIQRKQIAGIDPLSSSRLLQQNLYFTF
jgi:hypothetical protein